MSRSNKPRMGGWRKHGGGHGYRSSHLGYPRVMGNRRVRHEVRARLKDVLFTDAFDEREFPEKKEHVFDRWWYD